MNLADTMLSEIRQSQKDKYGMIPVISEVPSEVKFLDTESKGGEGVKRTMRRCLICLSFPFYKMNSEDSWWWWWHIHANVLYATEPYTLKGWDSKFYFSFSFWPHRAACRISVPQPGIEPGPRQWKPRILTIRPPGNSQNSKFYVMYTLKNILFIYYLAVLGLSCSMQTQLWHAGSSSLIRNGTHAPALGALTLSHGPWGKSHVMCILPQIFLMQKKMGKWQNNEGRNDT